MKYIYAHFEIDASNTFPKKISTGHQNTGKVFCSVMLNTWWNISQIMSLIGNRSVS